MNGLKLGIGLEMQEVEAGLKTLTSKVTNTSQQLEGLLSIAPHINSRDFEVGIKRMKDAHEQFVKTVSAGIKIGWTKGKNSGSLRYDDLLGSRDRIEKSNSMIRDMLAGKVKTSFNKDELTRIAQLQEAILKGANMATAAVDRETISILKSIDAENKRIEKLKQSREARVSSLNNQISQSPLKTVKDLEKVVSLSKQVSAEMRKWNTAEGNARALNNDKRTAELEKQLALAKKNAQEEKRVLDLAQKQEDLLRRQNEANQRSIAGLTERFNISKKILDIQRQLVGTAFHDKGLIASQQAMQDPKLAAFSRKYNIHDTAYNKAIGSGDLAAQLKELNAMRQMLNSRQVQTGQIYAETAEIEKKIAKTKELIAEEKRREQEKRKQQKSTTDLANKEKELLEIEKRRANAGKIENKLARLQEEKKHLNSLINGWQSYYKIALRAGDSAAQTKAQQKLAALDKEKIKLTELIALERNRIRAVNQQKSLFNEQTSIFARLKSLAATYFSIYQVINFVKQIFNATKELERQKVALEGIVGSAAKATETFNKLKNMAIESPFSLMDLTGWTKQLSAYGIAVDELLPTTHKLAELSAGLGVDMSRLILAYGQVNAAAVLRGQELRQFTEAGVPLVDKLADKFTELNGRLVTTGEVFELISKRQVSFEMVSEILTDMTSEGGKFYNMQENLMGTLYGQWEKVKDMWQIGLKEVGDATNGVFMRTILRIQKVIKTLPSLVKALGFALVVRMAIDVWRAISKWPLAIKQFNRGLHIAKARGVGLAFAMRNVSKALTSNVIIAALSTVVYLFDALIRRSKEWKNSLDEINSSFTKDTNKMTYGLDKLLGKLKSAAPESKAFADAMRTLESNYGDYLNEGIMSKLLDEARSVDQLASSWGVLAESIKETIRQKQNYERLNSITTLAADKVVADVADSIFRGAYLDNIAYDAEKVGVRDDYQYGEYVNGQYVARTQERYTITDDIKAKLNSLTTQAVSEFLNDAKVGKNLLRDASGDVTGLDPEKLKDYIYKSALQFGLSARQAEGASEPYMEIFRDMKDGSAKDAYKEFVNSIIAMQNTIENKINAAFSKARENVSANYSNLIGSRNANAEQSTYNPYGTDVKLQTEYRKAFGKLVLDRLSEQQKIDLKNRDDYKEAMAIDDGDYKKGKAFVNVITEFIKTLGDPALVSDLNAITDAFINAAGTFDQTSANIRTNASTFKGFENLVGGKLTDSEKDLVSRYTKITEQNKEETRNVIKARRKSLEEEIESKRGKANYTDEVKKLERELSIIKVLASNLYYGIPEEEKSGGSTRAESIPIDLDNFIKKLKDAYEAYKNANKELGYTGALGHVRTNEQFTQNFGEFFHGNAKVGKDGNTTQFGNLANLKIGNKSVLDLLNDKFLQTELESGILDFEAAIKAVAIELENYATDTNGKVIQDRKAYANAAKQLNQYIQKVFAKDSLAIVLDDFENGLKKITHTFEQTSKAVDTYRKAVKNGTIDNLGSMLGVSEANSMIPKSTMQEEYIKNLVKSYNTLSASVGGKEIEITGDLKKVTDIYSLIESLQNITKMNSDNFGANLMGKPGEEVISALNKLADIIHEEMSGISGEYLHPIADGGKKVHGKDVMIAPEFMNVMQRTRGAMYDLKSAQTTSMKYGVVDSASIQALLKSNKDEAQAFFDAFMANEKSNMFFDLFGGGIDVEKLEEEFQAAIDRLKEKFKEEGISFPVTLELELEQKKREIASQVSKLNAEGGKFGLREDRLRYRNADKKYKERFDYLTGAHVEIGADGKPVLHKSGKIQETRDLLAQKQTQFNTLSEAVKSGTATEQQKAELDNLRTEIPILVAQLKQYNDELTKIGQNGALAAQAEKVEALANMQTKLNNFSQGMTQMQDAVIAVVDSIQSAMNLFSKFYDILHDGENPKWMDKMDKTMGDFIENFKEAVAPVLAVVAAIVAVIVVVSTLTAACAALQIAAWPLIVIMAALIVIAAAVAAVMTAIQAHDNNLQASIDDLKKSIEDLDREAKNLNATANRMTGLDKMKAQADALGKSMSKATAAAEQARLEEAKKNTDEEKVKEYTDASLEAENEFKDGMKDMLDELVGAVEDWSSAVSDAIRSAFQNGENAARSFRSTVKEMIGDVVQKMLEVSILQPMIESAIQNWTDQEDLTDKYTHEYEEVDAQGNKITKSEFDEEGYLEELLANIKDPKKAKKFYAQMLGAGDALIDAIENLPPELKDAYAFNSETSALSGGISGITEDTARQLEAIGNSQLIQLIQIKQLLETYAGGGLDRTHMAYVQTHLTLINNSVANIEKAITELRTTIVNPLHVTMV